MTNERRRTPARLLSVSATVLTSLVTVVTAHVPAAAGASITQTRAEIAALSNALATQEKSSEVSANRYDADKVLVENLTLSERHLQRHTLVIRSHISTTTKEIVKASVLAYVTGASVAQSEAIFNQNVTSSDSRTIYQDLVIGNLTHLRSQLSTERHNLFVTIHRVNVERQQATRQTQNMASLLSANIASANTTRSTLATVTSQLKVEIINYEIQAGANAARIGNISGEASAVAAASEVGGQSAANEVNAAIAAATPPKAETGVSGSPAGSVAGEAAVAAAKTQIGVPYVWGGETPGLGFDCSGLVQWAWAKAGYTIPRTTETQWAALQHIPVSALQPGDLLFYYNLDGDHLVDHVTMYVGSGEWGSQTTIAAAHTGTNISLAPYFGYGFIGAARP